MTEYVKAREQQVPEEVDEDMEDDQTNDSMDFGWASHLNGAQAKATQPGAASLVSLFAAPPSEPDSKTGKGWGAISRGTTNPSSKTAQGGPKAVSNRKEAGDADAQHGAFTRKTRSHISRSGGSICKISM